MCIHIYVYTYGVLGICNSIHKLCVVAMLGVMLPNTLKNAVIVIFGYVGSCR